MLIDFGYSHEEFTLKIIKEQNYFRLKESIKTKDYQLRDIEPTRVIDHNEKIAQNER